MAGGRGRKVTPTEAREHERRAWELRCKGWTYQRIAAEIKVDQSAVCKILRRTSDRVLAELGEDVKARKVEQTAQLEHVADECLQAWERSKQAHKRVRQTKAGGEGEATVVQEASDQCGDVAYVEQWRAIQADIRKIWGLDAPTKSEHSGPGGLPLAISFIEVPRDDQPVPPAGGAS